MRVCQLFYLIIPIHANVYNCMYRNAAYQSNISMVATVTDIFTCHDYM